MRLAGLFLDSLPSQHCGPACWRAVSLEGLQPGTQPRDRASEQRSEPWTLEKASVGSKAGRSLSFTFPPSYVVGVEGNMEGFSRLFPEEGTALWVRSLSPLLWALQSNHPTSTTYTRGPAEGPGEDPGHVPARNLPGIPSPTGAVGQPARNPILHWGSGSTAGKT